MKATEYQKAYGKRKSAEAKAKGLCSRCYKNPSVKGGHCQSCLDYGTQVRRRIRKLTIDHYGGKCSCCGETNIKFLSIDHINGDGAKHRKSMHGSHIEHWLHSNGYPDGYQILCYNCNCGRQFNTENPGVCPHKEVEIF